MEPRPGHFRIPAPITDRTRTGIPIPVHVTKIDVPGDNPLFLRKNTLFLAPPKTRLQQIYGNTPYNFKVPANNGIAIQTATNGLLAAALLPNIGSPLVVRRILEAIQDFPPVALWGQGDPQKIWRPMLNFSLLLSRAARQAVRENLAEQVGVILGARGRPLFQGPPDPLDVAAPVAPAPPEGPAPPIPPEDEDDDVDDDDDDDDDDEDDEDDDDDDLFGPQVFATPREHLEQKVSVRDQRRLSSPQTGFAFTPPVSSIARRRRRFSLPPDEPMRNPFNDEEFKGVPRRGTKRADITRPALDSTERPAQFHRAGDGSVLRAVDQPSPAPAPSTGPAMPFHVLVEGALQLVHNWELLRNLPSFLSPEAAPNQGDDYPPLERAVVAWVRQAQERFGFPTDGTVWPASDRRRWQILEDNMIGLGLDLRNVLPEAVVRRVLGIDEGEQKLERDEEKQGAPPGVPAQPAEPRLEDLKDDTTGRVLAAAVVNEEMALDAMLNPREYLRIMNNRRLAKRIYRSLVQGRPPPPIGPEHDADLVQAALQGMDMSLIRPPAPAQVPESPSPRRQLAPEFDTPGAQEPTLVSESPSAEVAAAADDAVDEAIEARPFVVAPGQDGQLEMREQARAEAGPTEVVDDGDGMRIIPGPPPRPQPPPPLPPAAPPGDAMEDEEQFRDDPAQVIAGLEESLNAIPPDALSAILGRPPSGRDASGNLRFSRAPMPVSRNSIMDLANQSFELRPTLQRLMTADVPDGEQKVDDRGQAGVAVPQAARNFVEQRLARRRNARSVPRSLNQSFFGETSSPGRMELNYRAMAEIDELVNNLARTFLPPELARRGQVPLPDIPDNMTIRQFTDEAMRDMIPDAPIYEFGAILIDIFAGKWMQRMLAEGEMTSGGRPQQFVRAEEVESMYLRNWPLMMAYYRAGNPWHIRDEDGSWIEVTQALTKMENEGLLLDLMNKRLIRP